MKADVIYLRTSTEEQNPENQLKDVLTLLKTDFYETISEKQSAWKDEIKARPKFSELQRQIKDGFVKRVYVWDIDRIYRNRLKFLEFWALCKMKGVKIRSFRQNFLSQFENLQPPFNTMFENFIIDFQAWISEEESNKKSERVRISFQNHKGEKWGRPALPKSKVCEILERHVLGESIRKIAEAVKVSKSAVHKTIKENPQFVYKEMPKNGASVKGTIKGQ